MYSALNRCPALGEGGKEPKDMCSAQTSAHSPHGDHGMLGVLNTVTAVIQHTLEYTWQLERVSVQMYSLMYSGHECDLGGIYSQKLNNVG